LEGQGYSPASLGSLTPQEGSKLVLITTGSLAVNNTFTTLKQKFVVPQGAQKLSFKYNFLSKEYPEFVGSKYNDQFVASLIPPTGAPTHFATMAVNNSEANFQPISVSFPSENSGDSTMGHTGWRPAEINISQYAGKAIILVFTVSDVGDTIYDTGVLIDAIKISTGNETAFLSFPISGYVPSTVGVSTVLDHSATAPYTADGKVQTFGEIADKGNYKTPELTYNKTPLYAILRAANKPIPGINYNDPPTTYLAYDGHPGYDYHNFPAHTQVHPAAAGKAIYKGGNSCEVQIVHPNGYITRYLHMNENSINSKLKTKTPVDVTENDILGEVGTCNTGRAHLHFEVRINNKVADPYGWSGPVDPDYITNGPLWK
jgi:hypothetical protein